MDFLIDEGAGAKKVKALLRKHGHNVKAANEGELRAMKDTPLLKVAVEEKRLVITQDKKFGTTHDGKQYGVIIIDDKHPVTSELAERIVWTIEYLSQKPELLKGISLMLEEETPYGVWKVYPQEDNAIIEWMSYSVNQLYATDDIKFISTPVEERAEDD